MLTGLSAAADERTVNERVLDEEHFCDLKFWENKLGFFELIDALAKAIVCSCMIFTFQILPLKLVVQWLPPGYTKITPYHARRISTIEFPFLLPTTKLDIIYQF